MGWTCNKCQQMNSDWATVCGRCAEKPEDQSVFVVLVSRDGLPEVPEVFKSRAAAENRYIQLVNKAWGKNCASFEEAEQVQEDESWGSYEVRFFDTTFESDEIVETVTATTVEE